jgi:hypothetical protein
VLYKEQQQLCQQRVFIDIKQVVDLALVRQRFVFRIMKAVNFMHHRWTSAI